MNNQKDFIFTIKIKAHNVDEAYDLLDEEIRKSIEEVDTIAPMIMMVGEPVELN